MTAASSKPETGKTRRDRLWGLVLPILLAVMFTDRVLSQWRVLMAGAPYSVCLGLGAVGSWVLVATEAWRAFASLQQRERLDAVKIGRVPLTDVVGAALQFAAAGVFTYLAIATWLSNAPPLIFDTQPFVLFGVLAVILWTICARAILRACGFKPVLRGLERPTKWTVVGAFRLPLLPMFWVDVAGLIAGVLVALFSTAGGLFVGAILFMVFARRLALRMGVFEQTA